MQIYNREVLSSAELLRLYRDVTDSPVIWQQESFADAARQCGLKRIAARQGYFSFSAARHTTGQAIVRDGFIEEIRLFMGGEPRDLSMELFEEDRHKIPLLAAEYSESFRSHLGPSRRAGSNEIFESKTHRVRVLASGEVWVVLSNHAVLSRLKIDYWKAK